MSGRHRRERRIPHPSRRGSPRRTFRQMVAHQIVDDNRPRRAEGRAPKPVNVLLNEYTNRHRQCGAQHPSAIRCLWRWMITRARSGVLLDASRNAAIPLGSTPSSVGSHVHDCMMSPVHEVFPGAHRLGKLAVENCIDTIPSAHDLAPLTSRNRRGVDHDRVERTADPKSWRKGTQQRVLVARPNSATAASVPWVERYGVLDRCPRPSSSPPAYRMSFLIREPPSSCVMRPMVPTTPTVLQIIHAADQRPPPSATPRSTCSSPGPCLPTIRRWSPSSGTSHSSPSARRDTGRPLRVRRLPRRTPPAKQHLLDHGCQRFAVVAADSRRIPIDRLAGWRSATRRPSIGRRSCTRARREQQNHRERGRHSIPRHATDS